MVALEYYESQRQMFEVLKKEIKETLLWELQEIDKLEKAEATENRLKAIQSRKKRVEQFYMLTEMFEDILKLNQKMLLEAKKEIEFMKSTFTIQSHDIEQWAKLYKKLLNDRIKD